MRVDHDSHPAESASPKKKSFATELKKLEPKPQPKSGGAVKPDEPSGPISAKPGKPQPPGSATAKQSALKGAQTKLETTLVRGQKATVSFESSLVERRADSEVHRPEIKRVAQEIARILVEPPPAPAPRIEPNLQGQPLGNPQNAPAAQPLAPRAEALAGQIEKIIERAELLSKAEGPALQLGLSEGRASSIEVVRTGKGEVALRLDARTGSERRALAAQAGQIRAVLAQRGLRVRTLRVC
jgi:hypothetical protein